MTVKRMQTLWISLKNINPKAWYIVFPEALKMAKEVIKLGMYVGLGGAVTFKMPKHLLPLQLLFR